MKLYVQHKTSVKIQCVYMLYDWNQKTPCGVGYLLHAL